MAMAGQLVWGVKLMGMKGELGSSRDGMSARVEEERGREAMDRWKGGRQRERERKRERKDRGGRRKERLCVRPFSG